MVIFGYRIFNRKKGETNTVYHCDHCGNDSKWSLVNLWSWFTLFFIPIFPYWKKKIVMCPICNYGFKVTRKNTEEIMKDITLNNEIKKI